MDISSIPHLPAPATASNETSTPAPPRAGERAAAQALIQAVKAINAADLFGPENELTFIKDPHTNRMLTRVIARDSHQLVAQIPSDEVLRMAEEITGG
jgi:uncharacterized FlaG/YvyC family protein